MKISTSLLTALVLTCAAVVPATSYGEPVAKTGNAPDGKGASTLIPSRAVILYGDPSKADSAVLAVYYSCEYLDFNDPDAPRFMMLDREGKIAFGVGGSLYAIGSYDFKGCVDAPGFAPYDIAVPANPELRQRLAGNLGSSSLTANLAGKMPYFGTFKVYFQLKFNGDNGKYGARLKQAYAQLGHFTLGLTTSTFVDAVAQAPTIDPQGACGQIDDKQVLFRYTTPSWHGFNAATGVEIPDVSMTQATRMIGGVETAVTKSIPQRVPVIPAYVQYSWKPGSHVRLAALFRDLCYRDLLSGENRFSAGYGVKASFIFREGMFQPFGHFSYGKGISSFAADIADNGYDLAPEAGAPGRLHTIPSMTWTGGLYLHFTPNFFVTASASRCQVFDCSNLGGDSYRYGMFYCANAFYNLTDDLRVGIEYLHGKRSNYNGETGTANRLGLLCQFSF